jgi:hypothetical protein
MNEDRRDAWLSAALGAVALALRLAFRIDYDEDIDALRFALGVERFNVAELRPHAPYYPVVIAAAKVIAGLGASPRGALAILCALSGALLVPATALLAREVAGPEDRRLRGFVAGALAVVSPFLWLSSEKLLSDMPGTALTAWALWLCARARRIDCRRRPRPRPRPKNPRPPLARPRARRPAIIFSPSRSPAGSASRAGKEASARSSPEGAISRSACSSG